MTGSSLLFRWMASFISPKENVAVLHDPTLYQIQTKTQRYTGNIVFQNDIFMKVSIASEKQQVVKILKENIMKVEIHRTC